MIKDSDSDTIEKPQEVDLRKRAIAAAIIGVSFIVVLLGLALWIPKPTDFQYEVFRIVLALAAAGFAGILPGAISAKLPWGISAVGSLAVFAIVFFFSPAKLVSESEPPQGPLSPRSQAPVSGPQSPEKQGEPQSENGTNQIASRTAVKRPELKDKNVLIVYSDSKAEEAFRLKTAIEALGAKASLEQSSQSKTLSKNVYYKSELNLGLALELRDFLAKEFGKSSIVNGTFGRNWDFVLYVQ